MPFRSKLVRMSVFYLASVMIVACLGETSRADIKSEIAAIDKVMVRACQVAEINAARAKKDRVESFLLTLSNLEAQFRGSRNADALLACQKARAKYDPTAKKVTRPTKLVPQLLTLESSLQRAFNSLERNKSKNISDAISARRRKLTALQRGLVQRGDQKGSALVVAALRTTPTVPQPDANEVNPSRTPKRVKPPKDIVYLTYNRPNKRWVPMSSAGIRREVANGTTTLHYQSGKHWLLKTHWPDELKVGQTFSIEVSAGVFSVELVDLKGADASIRFKMPETKDFQRIEITRQTDRVVITSNGRPISPVYASGGMRGDAGRIALLKAKLLPAISVKKEGKGSFRNVKVSSE